MPLKDEEMRNTAAADGGQAEKAAGDAQEAAGDKASGSMAAEAAGTDAGTAGADTASGAEAADLEAQAEAGEAAKEEKQSPAAEVEALKQQLAEGVERMKRLQADFENFRRRTRQEKEELSNMVVQDFIKDLLPMLDNFDRAMAAEAADAAKFQQGVEMIYNQLTDILKSKGMERIETKDAAFDPNFHQAVMRVENPDLEDGAIAMEMQKGYMVKGRVIRPSMVQVVANS